MNLLKIVLYFLFAGVFIAPNNNSYKKFQIKEGVLDCSYKHYMSKSEVNLKITFSNFGATEYFENVSSPDSTEFPILKIDSLSYVFVTDTIALPTSRGPDTVYERCVFLDESRLKLPTFDYAKLKDTIYMNMNCEIYEFALDDTGQIGKAITWKKIPLKITSTIGGLTERFEVNRMNLESEIPEKRKRILDYVETE